MERFDERLALYYDELKWLLNYTNPVVLNEMIFLWENAKKRKEKESVQQMIFDGIKKMTDIRKSYTVFNSDADVWTINTGDCSVLGLVRSTKEEQLIALFNFSEWEKEILVEEIDGEYENLVSGEIAKEKYIRLEPYDMCWMMRK